MSEKDLTLSGVLKDLLSSGPKEKESLLDSIKKALSREEEVKMENGTVIIPDDENSVIIKQTDGNYVKAILTEDKSNVNLYDSDEEAFKKADLELRLYNVLTRIRFFKNPSNPCILEENQVDGDVPYCPDDLYLAKFHGLKNEIKLGEEDDALVYIIKFYESLCSGLFQEIVDIAAYLLGKEFNTDDSLKDCFTVTDNITTLIKKRYEGVPDTLTQYLSENELNKEKDSFEKAVTKAMFDSLPYLVGKLRKELGI